MSRLGRMANALSKLILLGFCVLLLTGPVATKPVEVRPQLPGHVNDGAAPNRRDLAFENAHFGRDVRAEQDFQRSVGQADFYVKESKEKRIASLVEFGFGDLNVRLPDEAHKSLDKVVMQHAKEQVVPLLSRKIKASKIFVVNSAQDVGSEVMFSEKVSSVIRERSRNVSKYFNEQAVDAPLVTLPFEEGGMGAAFSSMPVGSVLVLIGHIDKVGRKFVGGRGGFSVGDVSREAKKHGINIFYLGCDSAAVAAVGVPRKIDSLAVIRGLGEYLSGLQASSEVPIGELYSQVSRHSGDKVLIDPFSIEVFFESDVVDSRGDSVGVNYISFGDLGFEPASKLSHGGSKAEEKSGSADFRIGAMLLIVAASAVCGVLYNMLGGDLSGMFLDLFGHFLIMAMLSLVYNSGIWVKGFAFVVVFAACGFLLIGGWREFGWLLRARLAAFMAIGFLWW